MSTTLALLIGAKPIIGNVGHTVYVPKGVWRIILDYKVPPKFIVNINTPDTFGVDKLIIENFVLQTESQLVEGPCYCSIELTEIEDKGITHVNISLEKIR